MGLFGKSSESPKEIKVGGVTISLREEVDSRGGDENLGRTSTPLKITCVIKGEDQALNLILALFATYTEFVAHPKWLQVEITSISLVTERLLLRRGISYIHQGEHYGNLDGGGSRGGVMVEGKFTADLFPEDRTWGSRIKVEIGFAACANGLYSD